jgi:hypothetical protein
MGQTIITVWGTDKAPTMVTGKPYRLFKKVLTGNSGKALITDAQLKLWFE